MSYGITFNCSLVQPSDKDEYQMGVSIKNSDGVNINYSIEGDDPDEMMEEAIKDIVSDYLQQASKLEQETQEKEKKANKIEKKPRENDEYIAQLEKIVEDLTSENNSLKTDLNILQQRADDAVNKKMNKKKDTYYLDVNKFLDHFFDDKRFF